MTMLIEHAETLLEVLQRESLAELDMETVLGQAIECKEMGERYHRASLAYYVELGKRILEIKRRVSHGEFIATIGSEIGISQPTAYRYSQLALHSDRVNYLSPDLSLTAALQEIRDHKLIERRAAAAALPSVPEQEDRGAISWAATIQRKYKLSESEYTAMLVRQHGVCAICQNPERNKRLSVDHDHRTGKVRALLCGHCNMLLGFIERQLEDGNDFAGVLGYLEAHK
jgi:hypothetical protein